METVGTGFSTSLDAFIAGPEGEVGPLFDWYFGGQTEYRCRAAASRSRNRRRAPNFSGNPMSRWVRSLWDGYTSTMLGVGGWHPMDLPVFVFTHRVPEEWVYEGSPFIFVTDGVESAVEEACMSGISQVAGTRRPGPGR